MEGPIQELAPRIISCSVPSQTMLKSLRISVQRTWQT